MFLLVLSIAIGYEIIQFLNMTSYQGLGNAFVTLCKYILFYKDNSLYTLRFHYSISHAIIPNIIPFKINIPTLGQKFSINIL